jgi:hypothetical protein
MTDFTELREFTPEQVDAICEVICLRLRRDLDLPRVPPTPAVERRESTQPERIA